MTSSLSALLAGAIDIHVHTSPDLVPRQLSDAAAAVAAKTAGMRGLLIKSHVSETASRAQVAAERSGAEVFGALVLNHFVGGLNGQAVRAALALGAKVVFMPTFHAANHLQHHPNIPMFKELTSAQPKGISLIGAEGSLLPGVAEVLAAVVAGDGTLATGHISPAESAVLTKAALAAGVRRVILTHVLSPLVNMSLDEMTEIAAPDGVFVELSYLDLTGYLGEPVSAAVAVQAIRRVGPGKTILSSDGGQATNPLTPVEMMERFAGMLLAHDFTEAEVQLMVKENPALALGIGD